MSSGWEGGVVGTQEFLERKKKKKKCAQKQHGKNNQKLIGEKIIQNSWARKKEVVGNKKTEKNKNACLPGGTLKP